MSISMCTVVKNEAPFIGAAIQSVLPFVDEVVVVDTGSVDGTDAIAAEAGARVFSEPWPGDLGRAHQLPIAHARGDWILALDGDERLDARAGAAIPDLVTAPDVDAYLFTIRNYTYTPTVKWRPIDARDPRVHGAAGYRPSTAVRLFRRHPDNRYLGHVHQTLLPSIESRGGVVRACGVWLHHYGWLRADRAKDAAYLAFAEREVTARPDRPDAWIELATLRLDAGDPDGALAAARRASTFGLDASGAFLAGRALFDAGRLDDAVGVLERAIEANDDDASIEFDRADAWILIGRARGPTPAGIAAMREAVTLRPLDPVAANGLAILLADSGALTEAEAVLAPALARFPGLAALHSTAGTIALRRQRWQDARDAFATALGIDPDCAPALHNMALVHDHGAQPALARRCREAAAECRQPSTRGARAASPPRAVAPPGGVLTLLDDLRGDAARVAVDIIRSLPDRPHLVLCARRSQATDPRLTSAWTSLGARVDAVRFQEVGDVLAAMQPTHVVHHWTRTASWPATIQMPVDGVCRIAVVHTPMPAPPGHDVIICLSEYQARYQSCAAVHVVRPIGRAVGRGNAPPGPVTLVSLTSLDAGCTPRALRAALPKLDAELHLVGDGARRVELANELADRRVLWRGDLDDDERALLLSGADIGLHLTELHEDAVGWPIADLLAAGLPIVTQWQGCVPEWLTDGREGYLCTSMFEVRACLHELVVNVEKRRRMAAAARQAHERNAARFGASIRRVFEHGVLIHEGGIHV